MFCNLILIFNTVSCKLIASNTLQIPNSIPIHDQTITLTVWFLFRYQIILTQNYTTMPLLLIADEYFQIEVKVNIDVFQTTRDIYLCLFLYDQVNIEKYFYHSDQQDGWYKLQIWRDGCSNKLEFEDISLKQNCSKKINALLDICFFQCFNLYVYDTDELINEEIIIPLILLKEEVFNINTDKKYLVFKVYSKFYTNIQRRTSFFRLSSYTGTYLAFDCGQNSIYVSLVKYNQDKQFEDVLQLNILYDQWFLFSIEFNQKELLMYYYINNEINQLSIVQINTFSIATEISLSNREGIVFDSLQIISQLTGRFVGSCISICYFCISGQCQDEIQNKSLDINISGDLRKSIYFNESYFTQNQCDDDQFYFKDGLCQERPKYRGEYCIDCNISRISIFQLNNISTFSILAQLQDFIFYLKTQPKQEEYENQQNNGLIFQDDLNIYLMKSKDIYLAYQLTDINFCEKGYQYHQMKCIKYKKAIFSMFLQIIICKQKYYLNNKNCILCQQHCLYCKLERKILRCILIADDHFLNDKGILKKCTQDFRINSCLSQKEAIENLETRGYQVCQNNTIYSTKLSQCEDIAQFYLEYYYLKYFPEILQIQDQKLEFQYQLDEQAKKIIDVQISYLIQMQQLQKLSKQINYYAQKYNIIRRDLLFQQLSLNNQTPEDISTKKITLQNIRIILKECMLIIFRNRIYRDINEIIELVEDQYQILQFDFIFDFQIVKPNQKNSLIIDFSSFNKKTYIYNIRFKNNFPVLIMNTNRFIFKCNKIIFNNIILDNDDRIDIFYKQSPLFEIHSDEILITNLIIKNKKLGNLFYIHAFKNFKIQNISITDSMIDTFIRSSYFKLAANVEIEDIHVTRSVLIRFIMIEASTIKIQNINYFRVIMKEFNFFIDYFQKLYFQNIYLDDVQFDQSYLLKIKENYKIDSKINNEICILNSIHIKRVLAQNSIFFYMVYMQYIEFNNLFINSHELYNTYVIQIDQAFNLSIEYFIINQSFLLNQSILIDVTLKDSIKLNHLYLHYVQLSDSHYPILISADRILGRFLYFDWVNLNNTNLLSFHAHKINCIKNLMFIIANITQSEQPFFQFSSEQLLSIQNAYFIDIYLQNSHFIKIQSGLQLLTRNLQLIYILISNNNQESLILINISQQRNIFQKLVIKKFKIQNQFRQYYIIKLINKGKMIINNFWLLDVDNLKPQNQIVVFDNQLSSLKLQTGQIQVFYDIQLIISKSNYLVIKNCFIDNITQLISQEKMAFILETSSRYSHPYIRITQIRMIRFEGRFLFIESDSQIQLMIDSIEFTKQLSYFQFLYSENRFKGQIAWINNINITWQGLENWTKSQMPSILVEGSFDKLRVNQVYLKNFCGYIFLILQYRDVIISNFQMDQFRSNQSILFVRDERELYQQLSIVNFTLTNSFFEQFIHYHSVGGSLIIEDVKIKDAKLQHFIVTFHTNQYALVIINNIILKNVTSYSYLFYSTNYINYQRIYLIEGNQFVIFGGSSPSITFSFGLIVGVAEPSLLTVDQIITLDQSEVHNSTIQNPSFKLRMFSSSFLGKFSDDQTISVFISLNNGQEVFQYKALSDNEYLVQFHKDNTYLYLPSGRNLENYKYFNYVTGKYDKLYDGISFVNLKEVEEIICITKQVHNDKVIVERNLLLKPGITKLKNIIFTLNPLLKDQHIKYDIICNQSDQLITYRLLVKTLNCQLGEVLYKDSCSQCNIDLKLYSVGYNSQYCLFMDQTTMEQLDIGQIKLFKQYWRYSYANKYIEYCKSENCQGGWKPGDQSCHVGYVGALCQECDVYDIRGHGSFGRTSSQCSQCYFGYQIYIKGFLLVIIQIGLIYLTFYQNQQLSTQYLLQKISKRNFIEILLRQNVNQVTVLFKLLYNYLFTLYLLKDINNFGKIVDLSLNVISNPSFIAVPQFDCLITQIVQYPIQYTQLLLKILVPILIINLVVIIYIIFIKLKYVKYGINVIIIFLVVTIQQNYQVILQRYFSSSIIVQLNQQLK